jgi:hypothetical protein
MADRRDAILEDVMDACDAILTAIEGRDTAASGAALMIALIVLAHDEKRSKEELLGFLTRRMNESWGLFTRGQVEHAISNMRKRRMN